MLLAAGLGRRMLPLTLSVPKPAIPVLGRPMAVQILARLAEAGVERAVVNLHHLAERARRAMLDGLGGNGPEILFSVEAELLGTGGGIRRAAEVLRGAGPVLLHNGDFLSDIPLARVMDAHRASGMAATLVLISPRPGYATVAVDSSGAVRSLAGRPELPASEIEAEYLFTGCHVIDEQVLDLIPERMPSNIVSDVYRDLARTGRIGSYLHDGFWWEFGGPRLYLEGHLELLDRDSEHLHRIVSHDPIRRLGDAVCAIGPGTAIDRGARFEGRVTIGFASRIGGRSSIRDSVVLPEAWIGPGCDLRRVVVGPGCELPAGTRLSDTVICNDQPEITDLPETLYRQDGMVRLDLAPSPAGR